LNFRVEYTDCLGRTRRCLKTDLSVLKKQNNKLADSLGMGPRSRSQSRSRSNSPERKPRPPTPPLEQQLVSGDMQRESMREKWEQQESEMRKKEDIHYQDILFDGRSIDTLFNLVCCGIDCIAGILIAVMKYNLIKP
jgi:hypothetical protein